VVRPRVVIVSRIFPPEVSAAGGILQSWAVAFRDHDWDVRVVTTKPPPGMTPADPPGITVRRAPVLRDRDAYVRSTLGYLSFDVPLGLRLLFGPRADLYVVEPPPTTIAVVRVVAWLRRTPYLVDAADLWSDAASMVTRSGFVLRTLRRIELWGLRGATRLLAAHEPLIRRFRELGIATPATPIGFGADVDAFGYDGESPPEPPVFVYAGSHSEWHGAGVFVEAFAELLRRRPGARLRIIGNGSEHDALRERAIALGIGDAVRVEPPIPPHELSPILAGATASLASLKPGQGYDYAFTTKVYSSLAAGCPVVFAGVGPTVDFLASAEPGAGVAVAYDPAAVADALERAVDAPLPPERRAALSRWVRAEHSLQAIAKRVVAEGRSAVSP